MIRINCSLTTPTSNPSNQSTTNSVTTSFSVHPQSLTSNASLVGRSIVPLTSSPSLEDLISQVCAFLPNQEKKLVMSTLDNLTRSQREKLLPILQPLTLKGPLKASFIQAIALLKEGAWEPCTIQKVLSFFRQIQHLPPSTAKPLLQILEGIPLEQRDSPLVGDLLDLFCFAYQSCQDPSPTSGDSFVNPLNKEPADRRKDLIHIVANTLRQLPCYSCKMASHFVSSLLRSLQKTSHEKRASLLQQALPFLLISQTGHDVSDLLKTLDQLANSSVKEQVLQEALKLLSCPSIGQAELLEQITRLMKKGTFPANTPSWLVPSHNGYMLATCLKVFHQFPPSETEDLIIQLLPILQSSSLEHYEEILSLLKQMTQEQRKDCLELMKPYTSIKGLHFPHFLKLLSSWSEEERHTLMMIYAPFLAKAMYSNRCDILPTSHLPEGLSLFSTAPNKEELLSKLEPLSSNLFLTDRCLQFFLKKTAEISHEEFLQVATETTPLWKDISDLTSRTTLVLALIKVSQETRDDVISQLALLQPLQLPEESILQIAQIPQDQRGRVMQIVLQWIKKNNQGILYPYTIQKTWKAVQRTSLQEQQDLLTKLKPLLQTYSLQNSVSYLACDLLASLFDSLAAVPLSSRSEIAQISLDIITNTLNDKHPKSISFPSCVTIIRVLQNTPEEQRPLLLSLFYKLDDSKDSWDVLEKQATTLKSIGSNINKYTSKETELLSLINNEETLDLLKRHFSGSFKGQILSSLLDASEEERKGLLLQAKSLLSSKKIQRNSIDLDLFRSIQEIPQEHRNEILSSIKSWDCSSQTISLIFEHLDILPQNQKLPIIQQVYKSKKILSESFPRLALHLEHFIRLFSTLSPEKRDLLLPLFVQEYQQNPSLQTSNLQAIESQIMQKLAQNHPTVWTDSHPYLLDLLTQVLPHQKAATKWAQFFLARQEVLGIPEEHPLFQKSLEILGAVANEVGPSKINPYQLHNQLTTFVQQEDLLSSFRIQTPYQDILINFPLSLWRQKSQTKPYTIQDLPQGISSEGFYELFSSLEERHLDEQIQQTYEKTLDKLKETILHGEVFTSLLRLPQNPQEPLAAATLHLYTILHFLLQQDPNRSAQDPFSPQERALLNFASLVTACKTGQLDGISIYYNELPLENRMGSHAQTQGEEALFHAVDASVQTTIHKVLSSDALLRELAQADFVGQQSHQTLFLKNRLHKQLGISHSLTFDLHGRMIHPNILSASSLHLIKSFFSHCSLRELTKNLQEEVQKSPTLLNHAFKHLTDVYQQQEQQGEFFFTKVSALSDLEKSGTLPTYLHSLSQEEQTLFFTSQQVPNHSYLHQPVSVYLRRLQEKKLTKLLQANQPLSEEFAALYKQIGELKRASDKDLTTCFGPWLLSKPNVPPIVSYLEQLPSSALEKSARDYLGSLERQRENLALRQYLTSLDASCRSQTLQGYLNSFNEGSISSSLYEDLKKLPKAQTIQKILDRLTTVPSLSQSDMDLLEELHRLSDDEKKLSLRSILWQKSNNPVHQTIAWFLDHSDTPNPIKNRLRKHSYQEEYAGYTLYELLRSLPPSDLPVDPQEVLDWLKDRSYIQHAFSYTRINEGKLVTSLTLLA